MTIDREAPTAVFFVQSGYPIPKKSEAFYYRRSSAGSKLSPRDVDSSYIASAKVFHVTGITPALSDTAREATALAVRAAKDHKLTISLDTNIRLKLWKEQAAREMLLPLCKMADIVFTSVPDAKIILGLDDPHEIAKALHKNRVTTVIVKLGSQGSFASSGGETITQPMIPASVEDHYYCH